MKLALLSLLTASAAAFAPSTQKSTSVTALNAFDSELGAQEPLGFWDPLNLVYEQDQERFDRLRYVELKHGRIAMLAVSGHIYTSAGNRLAGDIDYSGTSFADIKVGIAGLSDIPPAGLLQIIAFIGFLELNVMKDVKGTGEFPGDFRNGFDFGWDKYTEEEKMKKRAIELNNGRAAQMGILGLMVHEQLGQDPYVINSLLGYPTV
mmetsp:Transcript_2312/g.1432  ORF Transcript_2312/g.1432 Transcript_2312/m.1432 type:complete len:206 (+) Transcript_2312:98-715(+)